MTKPHLLQAFSTRNETHLVLGDDTGHRLIVTVCRGVPFTQEMAEQAWQMHKGAR